MSFGAFKSTCNKSTDEPEEAESSTSSHQLKRVRLIVNRPDQTNDIKETDEDANEQELQAEKWAAVVNTYEAKIKLGPTIVCGCCGRLWFNESTFVIKKEKLYIIGFTDDEIDMCSSIVL
ncbi:hypothetical protein BC941DRAFT_457817 [Chlamydoabsidia padenii]|nr:hypothetical protein BC941DRAFT_457817 [Chlamydoabsidia padenii]